MSHTWEELKEEYSNDQFPPFGGPFTDALDPWEWLSKNFDPPKRTEETKIKVTVKKDSEMAKMVDTMRAEKQDFKNRVESGEFSGSYMKQTAVEWLVEMLIDNKYLIKDATHLFEQAKQMEKEQMCKFVYKCHNHYKVNGDFKIEQYYNETYGK